MRHGNKVRKFGREKNQRVALMKGLVLSLVKHGKITTTDAKARSLRPMIEKIVTRARKDTVANRRIVLAGLYNSKIATDKLFKEIGPKNVDRAGGYTRITKLPPRVSDGSKMSVIEFV